MFVSRRRWVEVERVRLREDVKRELRQGMDLNEIACMRMNEYTYAW